MSILLLISAILASADFLCLICLISFGIIKFQSKRAKSVQNDVGKSMSDVYEDEDGVASADSQKKHSALISQGFATITSLLGLSTAIAFLPLLKADGSERRLAFFAPWIFLADWIVLSLATLLTFGQRQTVSRFQLGIATAIASFSLCIAISFDLYHNLTLAIPRREDILPPLLQAIFALGSCITCLSIPRRPSVEMTELPVDRQNTVSALSYLLLAWSWDVLNIARAKHDLKVEDLPLLHHKARASRLLQWYEPEANKRAVWKTLIYMNAAELIFQTLFAMISAAIQFAPQFLLYKILKKLEDSDENWDPIGMGFLVAGVGIAVIASSWGDTWNDWIGFSRIGIPTYAGLAALVFSKATRRKDVKESEEKDKDGGFRSPMDLADRNGSAPTVKRTDTVSEASASEADDPETTRQSTINLVSVDAMRVSDFFEFHYLFVIVAVELVISVVFLVNLLGWIPSLAGFGAFFLTMPLNIWVSKSYTNAQSSLMEQRDRKLTVITEALQGIRQIKFAAQEGQWQDRISVVRATELQIQWRVFLFDTGLMFIWILGPLLLSAVGLAAYATLNGKLSASVAFTAITVFSSLEFALAVIPEFTANGIEAWVSIKRIDKYLKSPERTDDMHDSKRITFSNATISWPSDVDDSEESERFKLRDINVKIPDGDLTVIDGPTGAGKSLFLASIIGEADLLNGTLSGPAPISPSERYSAHINKTNWIIPTAIAFVAQIPWIQNASIKENILFGLPFDKGRYNSVIQSCALEKDLDSLDDGDETDIGFNGINLSGGQKWRVSFARALYSRAGILVLDDVFSAVDAYVGKHLYDHALTGDLGRNRTRILVTHHIDLVLPATKYLISLGDGTVKFAGSPESLEKAGGLEKIMSNRGEDANDAQGPDLAKVTSNDEDRNLQKVLSAASRRSQRVDSGLNDIARKVPRKFVEDEAREKGTIKLATWQEYISNSGGLPWWLPIILLFVAHQLLSIGRNYFVTIWTRTYETKDIKLLLLQTSMLSPFAHATNRHSQDLAYYLAVYICLSVVLGITGALRYYAVYTRSITASKNLFENMLTTVLRTPLRWLDTVPVGRILNRFTADFEQIDDDFGQVFGLFIYELLQVVGIIISAVLVSPLIIPVALILLTICGYVTSWYLTGAREVKRLESVTKSPILELFGTTLSGIGTIRAFDKTEDYITQMFKRIDAHARATWHIWLFNRWVALQLNIIGSIFATAVAAFVAFSGIDASLAGFALGFALQYSTAIVWATRFYSQVDLSMNCVERIREYSHLPVEPQGGEITPPAAWPTKGELEVEDLVAAYAPDLPPVLKRLSFTVAPGTRVGVVGRTGAGKSSLTLALFRFLEAREGCIRIDGLDVSKIPLHDLRSRLAIIPQDPVLFSGTIRSNLDPFNLHEDTDLNDALTRVHLSMPLSASVSESGLNLSQGQRQLLCLARAIVVRPKLLVLDEATSAVDKETDTLIQRSIRSEFGGATLLVIAHRLSTIADFEKVLVMEGGEGVEFGSPEELVGKKRVFWGLVERSGEKDALLEIMAGEAKGKGKGKGKGVEVG